MINDIISFKTNHHIKYESFSFDMLFGSIKKYFSQRKLEFHRILITFVKKRYAY